MSRMQHPSVRYRLLTCIVLIFTVCLGASRCAYSEASRVLILAMAEGVSSELLASAPPRVRQAIADGAVGLMNATTAGSYGRADSYASVALGTRAFGGSSPVTVANGELQVDTVGLKRLNTANGGGYGAVPGVLARGLAEANVTSRFFCGLGPGGSIRPEAALAVADRRGRLSQPVLAQEAAFGPVLDLMDQWLAHTEGKRLAVVELGGRTPRESVAHLSQLLAQARSIRGATRVIFVSPNASAPDLARGHTLMPVFMWGSGVSRGILTSPSTRVPGVVTNTDVAPTVLKFFSRQVPWEFGGRAMGVSRGPQDSLAWLVRENKLWAMKTAVRDDAVPLFVGFLTLTLALSTSLLFARTRASRLHAPIRSVAAIAALITLWWPIALLVVGVWVPMTPGAYRLLLLGTLPLLFWLAMRTRRRYDPASVVIGLAGLMCGAVMLDQLTGGHLVRHSVLSYDLQTGARFYGLGNEYEGLSIGAFITLSALLRARTGLPTPLLVGASTAVIFIIGAPFLGADVGGVLAAVVGFAAVVILSEGKKPNLLGLLGLGFACVLLLGALESALLPASTTHLGRALSRIGAEGPLVGALQIASRKLTMNLATAVYTPLGVVYAAVLVGLLVLFRSGSRVHKLLSGHRAMLWSIQASLLAAIVAFVFNDSGVVASSMAMIPTAFGFIYIVCSTDRA